VNIFKHQTLMLLSTLWASLFASALLLSACGGGGANSSTPSNPPTAASSGTLTGVAVVGAPLADAIVTLKDANGVTKTATVKSDGSYSIADADALTPPLMIQVKGTAGGTDYVLHSLLTSKPAKGETATLNATPATEVVLAQTLGANPANTFADSTKIKAVDATKLDETQKKLVATLSDVLTALGQDPAKVDLTTTVFTANGKGLDKLFDMVAFTAPASASGTATVVNMQVTNKNTGASATVAPTDTAATAPKIPAPTKTEVDFDPSTVYTLINDFNSASANTASAAFKDLFDPNYLHKGETRDETVTSISNGGKLSSYVLQGCDAQTKICQGDLTFTPANGGYNKFSITVKLSSDGKWRFWGDRAEFNFSINPIANRQSEWKADGTWSYGAINYGMTYFVSGRRTYRYDDPVIYKSAKFERSTDDGANYNSSFVVKLKYKSTCPYSSWLPLDDGNPSNCSNFLPISDATAAKLNSSNATGKAWTKVTAYANDDYTGASKSFVFRSKGDLLTAATAAQAVADSGLGVNGAELGTNEVNFTGAAIDGLNMFVYNVRGEHVGTSGSGSYAKTYGNKASVALAYSLCIKENPQAECLNTYNAATNKINALELFKNDAQGRSVAQLFYKTGFNPYNKSSYSSTTVELASNLQNGTAVVTATPNSDPSITQPNVIWTGFSAQVDEIYVVTSNSGSVYTFSTYITAAVSNGFTSSMVNIQRPAGIYRLVIRNKTTGAWAISAELGSK
jgi:hypothetical protein